jgi:hypothetical protein
MSMSTRTCTVTRTSPSTFNEKSQGAQHLTTADRQFEKLCKVAGT